MPEGIALRHLAQRGLAPEEAAGTVPAEELMIVRTGGRCTRPPVF